jgi:hypothetical protein
VGERVHPRRFSANVEAALGKGGGSIVDVSDVLTDFTIEKK